MVRPMIIYEPIMLAIPLAKRIKDQILRERKIPDGDDLRKILTSFGLEETCLNRGLALFRSKYILALLIPSREYATVNIISSTGDLSDALELMIYHDKTLNAYIIDIVPANELEFEGNVGIEPVIIDAETFELKSTPVLGHFEKENGEIFLVISENTYDVWKKVANLNSVPYVGLTGLYGRKELLTAVHAALE